MVKFFFCLAVLLTGVLTTLPARSQIADTTYERVQTAPGTHSNDYKLFSSDAISSTHVEIFLFLFLVALLVMTSIGLAFLVLMVLLAISIGLASSGSRFTSFYNRLLQDKFRTFFEFGFAAVGTLVGILFFWAIPTIQHWLSANAALMSLVGAGLGFIMGYGIGILVFLLLRKLVQLLLRKLVRSSNPA
ncbi:MAG: hypothetical protein EOP52_02890 [Sphingobacteriales bacterium]|nr:MAG: hypothetical protein EOP52_02890 [Sphingobacteriales bacterium]